MPQGMTTDTQFERSLSELAYSSLQDKTPALLDYLVGFQLLDSNDEQTKAVGVFASKVGDEWIYVPIWYVNGELKDGMMYLKNQDIFVPQTETWVSYIMNRRPFKMGEPTELSQQEINQTGPDLLRFRNTPRLFGKTAAHIEKSRPTGYIKKAGFKKANISVPLYGSAKIQPWAADILGELMDENFTKKASAKLDLISFLSDAGPSVTKVLVSTMIKNSGLADNVLKFYTIDQITGLNSKFTKTAANDKATNPIGVPPAMPDVRIVKYGDKDKWDGLGMTEADKKKLINGELVIKDNRNETSKVYRASLNTKIETPNMTGLYNIVTQDCELLKAFVIKNPISVNHYGTVECAGCGPTSYDTFRPKHQAKIIAINQEGNGYWCGNNDDIFGTPIEGDYHGYRGDYDKLPELSSIKEGGCYAIVNQRGTGTVPFRVLHKSENTDDTVSLYVSDHLGKGWDDDNWSNKVQILIQPNKTGSIKRSGDTIFVPSNCKVVEVKVAEQKQGSMPANNYGMPKPSSMQNVENFLYKNKSGIPLKLYSNGTEYSITVGDNDSSIKTAGLVTYTNALKHLIFELGVKGTDAEELLKQANADAYKHRSTKYFLTFAQGYPNFGFTKQSAPLPPPENNMVAPGLEEYGNNAYDNTSNIPMQAPVSVSAPVQGMLPTSGDQKMYDPNPQLDQNPWESAQQAAQMGQKDVFDTALIGGLVKTVDSNILIDRYVGDLILGLDRIGRILFLFYQHNDNFKDRYGQSDLIELEDNLRNTFKSIGDLVMFLKQKTLEKSKSDNRTKTDIGDGKR